MATLGFFAPLVPICIIDYESQNMSPLFIVAKNEIRIALREKLVVPFALIITFLLGMALYAGFVSYQQQQVIIAQTQQEKRQEWLNQGEKHPHIAAHYGTFVFKPKTVLSLFDFGLDAYIGTSVYLEAHHQHEFMFRPAQDHSSMIRFGELSAALVLKVLLPLLIIFLTFASFTRERERGTLKLLISQGISFSTITWGKILAYSIMLAIILLPFLIGIMALSLFGFQSQTLPDVAERTLGLMLIYGVYLFLFIAFSVWVSLRSSLGRNALLILLSSWIFLSILMPKTVANLSESFYSLPSIRSFKSAIEQDKAHGLDGKTPRSIRMANLERELLTKYQVDSVQQLPFNFEGVMMQAGEEYSHKVYDHHFGELQKILRQQNQLSSRASLLNPFLSVQNLSMALAGTDIYTFIHFEKVVELYRREMIRKMNNDMAQNSQYGEFYEYAAGLELWKQLPDFSYQSPSLKESLAPSILELVSLLLWVVFILFLIKYTNRKISPLHG